MAAMSFPTSPSGPAPVAVHYSGGNGFLERGWRIGDECFVKPGFFGAMGWRCSIIDGGVEIIAGQNHAKVAFLSGVSERLLPLRSTLSELGATSYWSTEQDSLDIVNLIRKIDIKPDGIKIEAFLPMQASFKQAINPDRIFVDIGGAELSSTIPQRPELINLKGRRVRIILNTSKLPVVLSYVASDTIDVKLADKGVSLPPVDIADSNPVVAVKEPPKIGTTAGPIRMASEKDTVLAFEIPVSGKLAGSPQFKRIGPSIIEITLPGARYVPPLEPARLSGIDSLDIKQNGFDTVMTFHLERPMGVVLSKEVPGVTLLLYKPDVGDGRLSGKIVVVDPGHGADDTGALSNSRTVKEKDLNLAIGQAIATKLSREGATVIMTRKTDVRIALKERSEIANRNNADFFVSVHINSNKLANSRSGSITFYHLNDPISSLLADCIQRQISQVSKLPSLGTWSDNRIYSSGFAVLRYAKMPAVLLELGFINHSTDLKRIKEPDFREKIADAVTNGIRIYLGNAEKTQEPIEIQGL
jgi:N-acetylmuramoyl-L-alanine amidase